MFPNQERQHNSINQDSERVLNARGIFFDDDSDEITVFASEENNLTTFQCREMAGFFPALSDTLNLTVIGTVSLHASYD
jgi:hypothetical protein